MQNRSTIQFLTITAVLVLLPAVLAPSVAAQRQRRDPHARRPDAPPTPRLADGKPNFGSTTPNKGAWQPHSHEEYAEILVDPKEGIPYQPWAKALKDYRTLLRAKDDPSGFCLPAGVPRAMMGPAPVEFIQQPELERIVMVYQGSQRFHIVYMDGRPHPADAYDLPTWTGHAVGRWEGDTLIVDTAGYNEGHWVDRGGSPRTNLHHVTERFTRLDYYAMEHQATIDDPGAYTRPWTIKHIIEFNPESEIQDFHVCQENNHIPQLLDSLKLEGEK